MTKNLKWRLGKLPTVEELLSLVKDKIITKDEAKEILFSHESKEDRDNESLKEEIKFLRELVDNLSQNRNKIIETIREVQIPYRNNQWYVPYEVWCKNTVTVEGIGDVVSFGNTVTGFRDNFTSINTF